MRRELVTLQIGTTANYVGTHFWNLQDEYLAIPPQQRELSPTTFFREVGTGTIAARRGLRYAPRLQVIDASGAFGALSTDAGTVLKEQENADRVSPAWSKRVQRYVREPVPKSAYVKDLLNEESGEGEESGGAQVGDVRFWSDYLKTRLHPRTCFPLQGVHHGVKNLGEFEVGVEMATGVVLEEAYEELRYFVEECDSFGGLCILANADDAYGGFSKRYMEHLREELGGASPVLVFGTHDLRRQYGKKDGGNVNAERDVKFDRLCSQNEAKLVAACLELSTEYVPFSMRPVQRFPLLHTAAADLFQNSAVLGTAMHVAFSPLQRDLSLAGLISAVRPAPFTSFGAIACNFPQVRSRIDYGANLFTTKHSVSFSGVYGVGLGFKRNQKEASAPSSASSVTDIVSARGLGYTLPVFANIEARITIPLPFPRIFDSSLERNPGNLQPSSSKDKESSNAAEVEQIAALAGLATHSAEAYQALNYLGKEIQPTTRKTAAQRTGFEDDELREVAEALVGRGADYLTV